MSDTLEIRDLDVPRGGRPVLHLGEAGPDEGGTPAAEGTFNHASFRCTDPSGHQRRLASLGIEYTVKRVPQTGQVQM